jgi:hypothetical protein
MLSCDGHCALAAPLFSNLTRPMGTDARTAGNRVTFKRGILELGLLANSVGRIRDARTERTLGVDDGEVTRALVD